MSNLSYLKIEKVYYMYICSCYNCTTSSLVYCASLINFEDELWPNSKRYLIDNKLGGNLQIDMQPEDCLVLFKTCYVKQ